MAVERTEVELRRAAMVKALRAVIRLKHSIAADRELNDVLPQAERLFDSSLHAGVLPDDIDVDRIVRRALDG